MFRPFGDAIAKQISLMSDFPLYQADVSKNELWELYLASFPEGTNPVYKVRTEHDCSCCKQFIRDIGGMVALKNTEIITIWDVQIDSFFAPVAKALADKVRAAPIRNKYSAVTTKLGTVRNLQKLDDGTVKSWDHFHGKVPRAYTRFDPTQLGGFASTAQVFKRGLEEIDPQALDSVLELISQNALYRGAEFKASLEGFKALQHQYQDLSTKQKDIFVWSQLDDRSARIRNTVIGTLLLDITTGGSLDSAVAAYEAKVAPQNYKRPKPVITQRMVADAMKTINAEGLEKSLYRRFAVVDDLSINDILFADRSVKSHLKGGVESLLLSEVRSSSKDFSKITEIGIEDFISKVLPTAESIEVCFENRHKPNLVSLVAPKETEAPGILKWGNNFSWSYSGNVTDSIKERVKKAGGSVDGYLRVSLSWFNYDDLDLHVKEPGGQHIYYNDRRNYTTKGNLDVDMNAGEGTSRQAVENTTWPNRSLMRKGKYKVWVHNYTKRESVDVGFEVEVECADKLLKFKYDKPVGNQGKVDVVTLDFDGHEIKEYQAYIEEGSSSQELWGIRTNEFHKVSMVMLSPNHWGEATTGNKHFMFLMEDCKNPLPARGFYNEFLRPDLEKFRKVFEVLGDKTKCEVGDSQLSGLGFSSTQPSELVCKVQGAVNRMLKIKF